jgi:Ni,Fe-hydrogenase III large subunit
VTGFQARFTDLDRIIGGLDRDTRVRFDSTVAELRRAIDAAVAANRESILADVTGVATTAARSVAATEVEALRGDLLHSVETTTRGLVASEVVAARTQLGSELEIALG